LGVLLAPFMVGHIKRQQAFGVIRCRAINACSTINDDEDDTRNY
jgi:hypothetical protein